MTAEAADQAVHRAAALLDVRRPAEALTALAPALAYDPHDPEALRLQAMALSAVGRHDDAVAAASSCVAAAPGNPAALYALADALLSRGDVDHALAVAGEMCALAPQDADCHVLRAEALLAAKRGFDAREAGWVAVRLAPNSVAAYDVVGRAQLTAWNPRGAEDAFRRALQLQPDNPALLNNLGVALRSQGDTDGAAELFAAAARADPTLEVAQQNTSGLAGHVGWAAGWVPVLVSSMFARPLFRAGYHVAGVAVLVAGVLTGLVLAVRRLRGALRRYVVAAARMRLPTRDRALRYAAAGGAFAAVLAASTRVAYRDRLLTTALAQAALLYVVARWAGRWRRRVPPPTMRPAPATARLVAAFGDLGVACVGAVLLVVGPFGGRPEWAAARNVSLALVPLLYFGWVDGRGGSRMRAEYGGSYVVDTATGRPPGFRRGLLRALVKLGALPVGALALALGARPPHDVVARTTVVRGIGT